MNLENIKITEYSVKQKENFYSAVKNLTMGELAVLISASDKQGCENKDFLGQVSILIPMYNLGKYICECIQSIVKQGSVREIVLFDDGSKDETIEYAMDALDKYDKDVDWKLIASTHRGQAASRNNALFFSSGEWTFYVDADDVLTDDAIRKLLETGINNSEYAYIYAYCKNFISPDLTKE